jgi:hypothetical protein
VLWWVTLLKNNLRCGLPHLDLPALGLSFRVLISQLITFFHQIVLSNLLHGWEQLACVYLPPKWRRRYTFQGHLWFDLGFELDQLAGARQCGNQLILIPAPAIAIVWLIAFAMLCYLIRSKTARSLYRSEVEGQPRFIIPANETADWLPRYVTGGMISPTLSCLTHNQKVVELLWLGRPVRWNRSCIWFFPLEYGLPLLT